MPRFAVASMFFLYGTLIGSWTARIPAVKRDLGLSDGRLSIALLGLAAGAIVGMTLSGRLVDRYGARAVLVPAGLLDGLMLLLAGLAPSLLLLVVALVAWGVVHGLLNIAMNAAGVRAETVQQRPLMSSFHAVYSVGGLAGSLLGGLFAGAGLGPAVTFAAVAALGVVLTGVAARWVVAAPVVRDDEPGAAPARMTGVWILGALAFCGLIGEGAAADWSTVYLRDNLLSSERYAAAAFAAFFLAMTAGRILGDRLVARFGPVVVVRVSGLLAAAGLGGALLVGRPVAGVIGFGLLGAGLSNIAPQVFSAAGHRNPQRPAQAIARVAGIGWLGFFAGPVLIGGTATLAGLPVALGIPVLLAVAVAAGAGALRVRHRQAV